MTTVDISAPSRDVLDPDGPRIPAGPIALRTPAAAETEPPAPGRRRQRVERGLWLVVAIVRGIRWRFVAANAICGPLPDFISGTLRTRIYRWVGFDIAPGASIMGSLELSGGCRQPYRNLVVGPRAIIGNHVTINLDDEVRIGPGASVSPYVHIYTSTHQVGPGSKRQAPQVVTRPVTVEAGCWICLGATVLPGVTVGRGSIVAAGSVVTRDVPPNTYVQGNPAQVVRRLPWEDR